MPTRTNIVVTNSGNDSTDHGSGGKRFITLDNGWLVTAISDYVNGSIFFQVSKDGGATYTTLGTRAASVHRNVSITSKGTIIYAIISFDTSIVLDKFDALEANGGVIVNLGSRVFYTLDPNVTAGGNTTVTVNSSGTEIHASWNCKGSPYPNSFNIRYVKGTISGDGSVTWGSLEHVTSANSSTIQFQNPSMIINKDNIPVILYNCVGSIGGGGGSFLRGISCVRKVSDIWQETVVDSNSSSYLQLYPSTVFVPQSVNGLDNGRIWVTWQGTDSVYAGIYQIRVAYSDDGGATWSTPIKLTTDGLNHHFPTLAYSEDDSTYSPYIIFEAIDASSNYDVWVCKYHTVNQTWGTPSKLTSIGQASRFHPITLEDIDVNFSSPLFICTTPTGIRFYGTWKDYAISISEGNIGNKPDRSNFLTYNITTSDGMATIIEKINGEEISSRTGTVSGQNYTVSMTQEQWDKITYGKYIPYNLLNRDGNCENSSPWTVPSGGTHTTSTTHKVQGTRAVKWTTTGTSYLHPTKLIQPKVGDYYVYIGEIFAESGTSTSVSMSSTYAGSGVSGTKTSVKTYLSTENGTWGYVIYKHYITGVTDNNSSFMPRFYSIGADKVIYADAVRMYKITKGEYDAIPSSVDFMTATEIAKRYPYRDSLTSADENTLTIEMGGSKWNYTFDKRLANTDDLKTSIKATQDLNTYLTVTKSKLATAINSKGISASSSETFDSLSSKISQIKPRLRSNSNVKLVVLQDKLYTYSQITNLTVRYKNGHLYLFTPSGNNFYKIDPETLSNMWNISIPKATSNTEDFAIDSQGNVYTGRNSTELIKITTSGVVTVIKTSTQVHSDANEIIGIAIDNEDNLVVAFRSSTTTTSGYFAKISTSGTVFWTSSLTTGVGSIRERFLFDETIQNFVGTESTSGYNILVSKDGTINRVLSAAASHYITAVSGGFVYGHGTTTSLRKVNALTGATVWEVSTTEDWYSIETHPSLPDLVFVGTWTSQVRIFRASDGVQLSSIPIKAYYGMAFNPDKMRLYVFGQGANGTTTYGITSAVLTGDFV